MLLIQHNTQFQIGNHHHTVQVTTQLHPLAADGQLWYSSTIDEVDIMVHNGTTWVGYKTYYADTNPQGPICSATAPEQSDGTALVDNDL